MKDKQFFGEKILYLPAAGGNKLASGQYGCKEANDS